VGWSGRGPVFGAIGTTLATLIFALTARAQSFAGTGDDLARAERTVEATGFLRVRGFGWGNLPPPAAVQQSVGPWSARGDLRARLDVAVMSQRTPVAVKARLDVLDNLPMGSAAVDPSLPWALHLKRVWGEALTPLGLLSAGRTGSHWGLGIAANGGDCEDCDAGDYADRIAFTTALAGHLWAVGYDLASGSRSPDGSGKFFDTAWTGGARTVSFAFMRWRSEVARERRARAGKFTIDYGAWISHRTQASGQPPEYGGAGGGVPWSGVDQRATGVDVWARLVLPSGRVEAEAVGAQGSFSRVDLMPGVSLPGPVESRQWGAALESEFGNVQRGFAAGIDAGAASGDAAPGFGAWPGSERATLPGGLDMPQLSGRDLRVDNFRFSPDYHVDRVLFRQIIGRVTDAAYVRPKARWRWTSGDSSIEASLAAVASSTLSTGTLGGDSTFLGVELDPALRWRGGGFSVSAEYGVLFPSAALGRWLGSDSARHAVQVRGVFAF